MDEDLTQYKKKRISVKFREHIWVTYIGNKFYGNCHCCSMKISCLEFACGHVLAEKEGGELTTDNIRVVCKSCNSKMGITNMNEFKKERYGKKCCYFF